MVMTRNLQLKFVFCVNTFECAKTLGGHTQKFRNLPLGTFSKEVISVWNSTSKIEVVAYSGKKLWGIIFAARCTNRKIYWCRFGWLELCAALCRQFTGVSVDERQSVYVYERRRHNTRSAAESTKKPCRQQTRCEPFSWTTSRWAVDKVLFIRSILRKAGYVSAPVGWFSVSRITRKVMDDFL